jgi:hypothetical protein
MPLPCCKTLPGPPLPPSQALLPAPQASRVSPALQFPFPSDLDLDIVPHPLSHHPRALGDHLSSPTCPETAQPSSLHLALREPGVSKVQ